MRAYDGRYLAAVHIDRRDVYHIPVHDYRDPDSPRDLNEPERFAANYRDAGGDIDVIYIDQETRSTSTSADPLTQFLRKHLLPAS